MIDFDKRISSGNWKGVGHKKARRKKNPARQS
jgi:hypothetical protein